MFDRRQDVNVFEKILGPKRQTSNRFMVYSNISTTRAAVHTSSTA